MDAHFNNQIVQARGQRPPVLMAFRGPARQFGSGGIGAFAMRMGRVALPLMKKYVMPVAKEFGKNLISNFVPEISSVIISGKKRPRAVLKETFKKSAAKTIKDCVKRVPTTTITTNTTKRSSHCGAPRRAARTGERRAGGRRQRRDREIIATTRRRRTNQLESFQSKKLSREVGQTYSLVFRLQLTTTTLSSQRRTYDFNQHIFGNIE